MSAAESGQRAPTARPKAALLGGGVIGGGWAARFLLNGWDVDVFDPDPEAARKIEAVLTLARRSLPALYDRELPDEGALRMATSVADAVEGADWIQESAPERIALKRQLYAEIEAAAPATTPIGSSTSGFKPSELQEGAAIPGRILVCHPFNPVYLLPLVEIAASPATDPSLVAAAAETLRGVGMAPLIVRKEIDAHIADRLLEAVWRESLWLVHDGIATTAEIDDAIRLGFGLRWAQMGLFETYRIAGGEAGMAHFLAQFGPALQWPWTKLTDVPALDEALVARIAAQSDAQSGHLELRELERRRDDNLVGILRALKATGAGAGGAVLEHEARLPTLESAAPHRPRGETPVDDTPPAAPAARLRRTAPATWADRHGRIRDAAVLDAFDHAVDQLSAGLDPDLAARLAEDGPRAIRFERLADVAVGDLVEIEAALVETPGDRRSLHCRLIRRDGVVAATADRPLDAGDA